MLQTYAANQLDASQNQQRGRHRQRTGIHCKEAETTALRVREQSTEPLHIHSRRSSGWCKTQMKATETMKRRYKRPDWQDSGGVHDNSKRQKEFERTGTSFRGPRPSAMKIENEEPSREINF